MPQYTLFPSRLQLSRMHMMALPPCAMQLGRAGIKVDSLVSGVVAGSRPGAGFEVDLLTELPLTEDDDLGGVGAGPAATPSSAALKAFLPLVHVTRTAAPGEVLAGALKAGDSIAALVKDLRSEVEDEWRRITLSTEDLEAVAGELAAYRCQTGMVVGYSSSGWLARRGGVSTAAK